MTHVSLATTLYSFFQVVALKISDFIFLLFVYESISRN